MTWQMISHPGFGIAENSGVPAMAFLKGELYVGVSNNDLDTGEKHAQLWKCFPSKFVSTSYLRDHWSRLDKPDVRPEVRGELHLLAGSKSIECMVAYGDFLYLADKRIESTENVRLIRFSEHGRISDPDPMPSFLSPLGISDMIVFRGELYALEIGNPLRIHRTRNPFDRTWEEVTGAVTTGAGAANYKGRFASNDTHLYLGTAVETPGGRVGAQIWRSENGSDWEIWISDGFGETRNGAITSMSFFDGDLYAATLNHDFAEGSKVFRIDLTVPNTYSLPPWPALTERRPLRASAVWGDTLYMGEGYLHPGAGLFVKETDDGAPSPFERHPHPFTQTIVVDPIPEPPLRRTFIPLYLRPIITSHHSSIENIFLASSYIAEAGLIIWREEVAGTRYVSDWIFNATPVRRLFRNIEFIPRLLSPIWDVIQSFIGEQEPILPPDDLNPIQ